MIQEDLPLDEPFIQPFRIIITPYLRTGGLNRAIEALEATIHRQVSHKPSRLDGSQYRRIGEAM